MCVFLISPVPIAEPLTSELIDTPVFYNLAPRPIKYRVSVPIPNQESPRSDIFRKRVTKPLLKQKHCQKHLTWAKEKKNWTVAQRFGLPCHLLVLVHFVFWSPQSTTRTFQSTSCCLLLTSFMEMLISFSSRTWHMPTLPKVPKAGPVTMMLLCLIGQQTRLTWTP